MGEQANDFSIIMLLLFLSRFSQFPLIILIYP